MTRARRRIGFTLLEVVLAITLSIMVMLGLLSLHRQATRIRDGVIDQAERITAERTSMDRLTHELRGAMTYPFLNFGLEGTSRRIQFMTASLPDRGVWAVRKTTEDPIPPQTDLELVGYRILYHRDGNDECVADGLKRTSQRILAAPTAEEGVQIDATLITPHIKFLFFQYYDGTQWRPDWTEGGLPLAVEVTMGYQHLPEDAEAEEYAEMFPDDTFRRVIYLPGSQNSQEGSILRGLGGGRR